MKQFISKVKNLSQKAAELKAAVQQVPPRVAEIREAVAATAGQLQQLKSEIHYSVADLKMDREDDLSEALQEINSNAGVFARAGFVLGGVDLEISPVQRMLVRLTKVEDVHVSVIRSLSSANQQQRTTRAILTSLLQAKQMAETVRLEGLDYHEVIVGIGPIPSIRLCWRAEEVVEGEVAESTPAIPQLASSATTAAGTPAEPAFGAGSFFEKRPPALPVSPIVPEAVSAVQSSGSQTAVAGKAPGEEVSAPDAVLETSHDPLARFKRMPNLSRTK